MDGVAHGVGVVGVGAVAGVAAVGAMDVGGDTDTAMAGAGTASPADAAMRMDRLADSMAPREASAAVMDFMAEAGSMEAVASTVVEASMVEAVASTGAAVDTDDRFTTAATI